MKACLPLLGVDFGLVQHDMREARADALDGSKSGADVLLAINLRWSELVKPLGF